MTNTGVDSSPGDHNILQQMLPPPSLHHDFFVDVGTCLHHQTHSVGTSSSVGDAREMFLHVLHCGRTMCMTLSTELSCLSESRRQSRVTRKGPASSSSDVLSSISRTSSSNTCSIIRLMAREAREITLPFIIKLMAREAREITLLAWQNPFLLTLPFLHTCSALTLQFLFGSALKRPSTKS